MKSVRGRQPLMPKSLMLAAANKASRLGREVAGDDLFLLAIAGLEGSPAARRALELEGAGLDRLTELIPTRGDEAAGSTNVTFPPSFYSFHGWA